MLFYHNRFSFLLFQELKDRQSALMLKFTNISLFIYMMHPQVYIHTVKK